MSPVEVKKLITDFGGVGPFRTKAEGPHPEAKKRMAQIDARITEEFGRLESLGDYENALQKAFPNAAVSLNTVLTAADTGLEVWDEAARKRKFADPKNLGNYYDNKQPEEVIESLKGFSKALLDSSLDDPETAALVGRIALTGKKTPYSAAVMASAANPLATPLWISINPGGLVQGLESTDDLKEIGSNRYAMQLAMADKFRGSTMARGTMNQSVGDSDAQTTAAQTAFHEWSHAKGFRLAIRDEDSEFIEKGQKWVTDGLPFEGGEELQEMAEYVDYHMPEMEEPTPEHVKEALRLFGNLGYRNVDISDQATLRAIYRAMALRYVVNDQRATGLDALTARLPDKDWGSIVVSGYGNSNAEEAVAEFYGLNAMMPEHVASKLSEGLKVGVVKDRL